MFIFYCLLRSHEAIEVIKRAQELATAPNCLSRLARMVPISPNLSNWLWRLKTPFLSVFLSLLFFLLSIFEGNCHLQPRLENYASHTVVAMLVSKIPDCILNSRSKRYVSALWRRGFVASLLRGLENRLVREMVIAFMALLLCTN